VLEYANLINVSFVEANLSDADLTGAYFTTRGLPGGLVIADHCGPDCSDADLTGSDLSAADLNRATMTSAQLAQAASLAGATMPDGTIHE
jgi:uncharacterized protein YjbI with pentapeptide repeats